MTETEATPTAAGPKENPWLKMAIEFGPLVLFFAVYKFMDIFWATGVFMVIISASMIYSRATKGHVPPMLWVTFTVVMIMGSLTLWLQDETFVKMKPSLVNGLFATILGFGLMRGRSYLKYVMEAAFPAMHDKGWMILTRNWALYFATMAVLNEIVWRSVSTDTWVNIKTFGYLPLTLIFAISQAPVMGRYMVEDESDKANT